MKKNVPKDETKIEEHNIKKIKLFEDSNVTIQTHAGRGDNIGRDIIVNYYKNPVEELNEVFSEVRGNINRILVLNDTFKNSTFSLHSNDLSEKYQKVLNQITKLQFSKESKDFILQKIEEVNDQINIDSAAINSLFAKIVYDSFQNKKIIESQIRKIGHQINRDEATTLLEGVEEIEKYLDIEDLGKNDFKVLSDEAVKTILILSNINNVKNKVNELQKNDTTKERKTTRMVIISMAVILFLLSILFGIQFFLPKEQTDIANLQIPILGIPIPVVIWGFIGSIASMIYRFNKKPIHDFGDSIKWLITRPIQGIILSCAFYLVLISGQFLFTGNVDPEQQGLLNSPEIILFLSFLIGFSDKFNESVFSTLIDKYSGNNKKVIKTEELKQIE